MKNAKNRKPKPNRRTLTCAPRPASKEYNAWKVPAELYPLRDWLAQRQVDVGSLKTARQALMLAVQLSKRFIEWPEQGEEFPVLLDLQHQLTGAPPMRPNPATRRVRTTKLGTFGAASEVRQIDPSTLPASEPCRTVRKKPGAKC